MKERPIECSHCKKAVKVIYREIIDGETSALEMCSDCPTLQEKLCAQAESSQREGHQGLCCSVCHTTLEAVRTGNLLGCEQCYTIFEDILMKDLIDSNKIVPTNLKKSPLLHIGHTPHDANESVSHTRLSDLNEALSDALQKENYEQAAHLRDQIKGIMDQVNEEK